MCSPRRTMFAEAFAAINRTFVFRLERYFGFFAAFRANYRKHLTRFAAFASAFTFVAAIAATCRLILEAFFGIKFLFARAEDEFFSAVLAHECFVSSKAIDKSPYNQKISFA